MSTKQIAVIGGCFSVVAFVVVAIFAWPKPYDFTAERQRFEDLVEAIKVYGEKHSQASVAHRGEVIVELRRMQDECRQIAAEYNEQAVDLKTADLDPTRCQE